MNSDSTPVAPKQRGICDVLSLPSPGKVPFSVEFMPPRDEAAANRLHEMAIGMHDLGAAFVAVTYGAGGSTQDLTMDAAVRMKDQPLTTLLHLTLVDHTVEELQEALRDHARRGLTNLLVLRGDPPGDPMGEWTTTPGGLTYASELIELIKSMPECQDFEVGIASFPEGHYRAADLEADTKWTLHKLRCGAEYSVTQMFFDVDHYLRLRDRLVAADAEQGAKPIIPGIMPITSLRSVRRQMELSGAELPKHLEKRLVSAAAGDEVANREAIREVGIEVSTEIVERLISEGVPDLHFMTMNHPRATQEVLHNVGMAPAWGGAGHDMVRGGF